MTETLARPKCFLHVVVRVTETLNPQHSAKSSGWLVEQRGFEPRVALGC